MLDLTPWRHSSPHDTFIREIAKYKAFLDDIPSLLPPMFLGFHVEALEPGSYVSQELRNVSSDLLFSCTWKNHPARLYLLFEHQTRSDWRMPFRICEYTVQLIKDYLKSHPKVRSIPLVIPVVFYQSKRPWRA